MEELMDEPVNVTFKDLGIVNGLVTVEVINADTGEVIGYNQSLPTDESES
jgi:hypothetical protein